MDDRQLQLLTAFVDGELSPEERGTVLKLLHDSSRARTLLRQLQENAHAIKQLPRRGLGPEFQRQVLQALRPRAVSRAGESTGRARWRENRRWLAAACAAALLLGAGTGLTLGLLDEQRPETVVTVQSEDSDLPVAPPAIENRFAFKDLADKRDKLDRDLTRKSGLHLEISVKNAPRAVVQIETVLREEKMRVLTGPAVRAALKQGNQGPYLVYLENIAPSELAALLQKLGHEAKNPDNFESFLVHAMTAEDRQLLAQRFGVKAAEFEPDRQPFFSDPFIETPKDGKPTSSPSNGPRGPERQAVVLLGDHSGPRSPELLTFLSNRQPPLPGRVQVLLVLG